MLRPKMLGLLALLPLTVFPAALTLRANQGPDLASLVQEQASKLDEKPG
jgi:hypothetical protein